MTPGMRGFSAYTLLSESCANLLPSFLLSYYTLRERPRPRKLTTLTLDLVVSEEMEFD